MGNCLEKVYGLVIPGVLCAVNLLVPAVQVLAQDTGDTVVHFPDAYLELALRFSVLDKSEGEITIADMESITWLSIVGGEQKISNIEGLQYARNVEYLHLGNNRISDIAPLAAMTNLQRLNLYGNLISDLSPLSELHSLYEVSIDRNQIADITPLAGLANLEKLDLYRNSISDLGPLSGLEKLYDLELQHNQVSDVGPLSGLMQLKYLGLNENQVTDLSPLSGLETLEVLGLRNNRIEDVSQIVNLPSLAYVELNGNQISDITPLLALTYFRKRDGLSGIHLENNYIDISPGSAGIGVIQHLLAISESPVFYIPQTFTADWAGFPFFGDGVSVDTGGFLGWIHIGPQSWIFCYALGRWLYCPEDTVAETGAWVYVLN